LSEQVVAVSKTSAIPEPVLNTHRIHVLTTAPESYLDSLAQNLLAKAKISELPEPVFNPSLKETAGFETPYMYFELLPEKIGNRVQNLQPASVWDKLMAYFKPAIAVRWTMAIIILGIAITGTYRYILPAHGNLLLGPDDIARIEKSEKAADEVYNSLTDEQISNFMSTISVSDTTILEHMDLHDLNATADEESTL
jgi:hypothetical protein